MINVNIQINCDINSKVYINVKDQSYIDVIKNICDQNNLRYKIEKGVIYIDKVHFCISISNFSITVPLMCRSFGMSIKKYVIWQSVLLFVGAMLVYLILRGRKIQNIKGEKYEI